MVGNASYSETPTMFVEINNRRIPLEEGNFYLLGKQVNDHPNGNDKNFIQLEDKDDIDQKHCVIEVGERQRKDVYIFDLFSSKGTLLNNKPLKSLSKILLKNGDIITAGSLNITFFQEQGEVSLESSGFFDVNRNTTDCICSSPDSTSQRENNINCLKDNNFLIPVIPTRKSAVTPNTSVLFGETEANKSKNLLKISLSPNNRRSDSFTIPDTQYCLPCTSINSSVLSVDESIPEANVSKIKFNFGNLNDEDDDFCIPETQEPVPKTNSQRPRIHIDEKKLQEQTVVEEKTAKSKAENSTKDLNGSQFRICTQEYNDGFGEEMDSIHSQIIPLITHAPVVLNTSSLSIKDSSKSQSKCERENMSNDKELTSIKRSTSKDNQTTTTLRADCSTPDIFDFNDLEPSKEHFTTDKKACETKEQNVEEEDEDDLLPTQVLPVQSEMKTSKDIDEPCVEKEYEEPLTLSDKENRRPITSATITDLPPTQLFGTNEASAVRSTSFTSSRRFAIPTTVRSSSTTSTYESMKNSKLLPNLDSDEEDNLLTQAFLSSSNSNANTGNKNVAAASCNSGNSDDNKALDKNPAICFTEMEKTPLKATITPLSASNAFKVPEKELSFIKKTYAATSTTSDSDLDLLMCTPQLIKEHLQMSGKEDLRKTILAVKNKNLFGDDTDEEETKDGSTDLVKLINVPKDSKDFDKLLPHLQSDKGTAEENEKERAAKEAQKEYKFNVIFGKEQADNLQSSTSRSKKASRDERHMVRDRKREFTESKEKMTSAEKKDNKKKTVRDDNAEKHERKSTRNRQGLTTTDKYDCTKEEETKQRRNKLSPKEEKYSKEKSLETKVENINKRLDMPRGTKNKNEKVKSNSTKDERHERKSAKATKSDHLEKQMPAKRITRSNSTHETKMASTSKNDLNLNKTKTSHQIQIEAEDDMDSVSTQPFVRLTRHRLNSKNSHESTTSTQSGKNSSRSETSAVENTSVNGSTKTTVLNERKRKSELQPDKGERKRLRSTHSPPSSNSTHSRSDLYISMTMVEPDLFRELIENSNGVWNIAQDPAESHILVMDKAFRTFKFLLAMARGIPIVTSKYLKKINELQSVRNVRITDYLFTDAKFEKRHKFSFTRSLQMAKKQKLFKDYEFLMTPNIVPNPSEIKAIIEAAGGLVHDKHPPEPKKGQQLYLVSSAEDKKEWHKYRRLNENIQIVCTEAIMSSVMRQTCVRMPIYMLI